MSRWFRMYEEILDDPKVQRLPADLFRIWVNVLALTSRNDGVLPSIQDCCFAFRETENSVSYAFHALETAGLLKRKNGRFVPNGWEKRQYKSDTSTDRVKRFRERSRNSDETPSETETESDTDKSPPIGSPPSPASIVDLAVRTWNETAETFGLAKVKTVTDARKRAILARWRQCGGESGWRKALGLIGESAFLLGANDRGWRADFDFLITPAKFTKLIEGGYGNTGPPVDPYLESMAKADELIARMDEQRCRTRMDQPPQLRLANN